MKNFFLYIFFKSFKLNFYLSAMEIQIQQSVNILLEFIHDPKTLQLVGYASFIIIFSIMFSYLLPCIITKLLRFISRCLAFVIIGYLFCAFLFLPASTDLIFSINGFSLGPGSLFFVDALLFYVFLGHTNKAE